MKSSKLNIMNFSDVHLGNSRTTSAFIIENLKSMLTPVVLSELDMLVIAGDLFDKELALANTWDIQQFIIFLIRAAHQHNIVIRILEGTPSHDRGQAAIINTLVDAFQHPVNVRYIDDILVEHIDSLNLDVLYVPDEWSADHNTTWYAVQEALKAAGLKTVHMSVMHGMFEHQLPNGIPRPCHSLENYSSITEYFIIIGHIHKFSIEGKSVACGSTDRLAFNEESPKGMVQLLIDRQMVENSVVKFIENTGAKIYKTFDISNIDVDDIETALAPVSLMPDDSYVAIHTPREPVRLGIIDSISLRYPNLNWRVRILTAIKSEQPVEMDEVMEITPINSRTISTLVKDKLEALDMPTISITRLLNILEEVK